MNATGLQTICFTVKAAYLPRPSNRRQESKSVAKLDRDVCRHSSLLNCGTQVHHIRQEQIQDLVNGFTRQRKINGGKSRGLRAHTLRIRSKWSASSQKYKVEAPHYRSTCLSSPDTKRHTSTILTPFLIEKLTCVCLPRCIRGPFLTNSTSHPSPPKTAKFAGLLRNFLR